MSNKLLVSLLIGVVVVVGAVLIFKGDSSDNAMMNGQEQSNNNEGSMMQSTSLKALLSDGSSQKCTFSHNATEGSVTVESSGVVYVGSGKMRGDFVSKTNGQTVNSHMIVDADTSYVWSDALNQGIKMKFSEMNSQTSANSQTKSVDVDQQLDYNCDGWNVDASVFGLPSGVTFASFDAMMGAGSGSNMMSAKCGACDQIQDANGKAQCKAALGC